MAKENNNGQVIGWVALIIAVIALIFTWMVYAEQSEQVPETWDEQIVAWQNDMDRYAETIEARFELWSIRAEIAAEENYEEAEAQVAETRQDLREAYQDASGEVRAWWEDVDADLEQLESDLEAGSVDALESLENAIDALQADLATENQ